MPVYIELVYSIKLKSEYQQQMNQMTTPFFTKTGGINYEMIERDELEELTATDDVEGYSTPKAFGKKKIKKISTNSTGYKVVKEALDNKDIDVIKKLIRKVVANIYRDLWLKRMSWISRKN